MENKWKNPEAAVQRCSVSKKKALALGSLFNRVIDVFIRILRIL